MNNVLSPEVLLGTVFSLFMTYMPNIILVILTYYIGLSVIK